MKATAVNPWPPTFHSLNLDLTAFFSLTTVKSYLQPSFLLVILLYFIPVVFAYISHFRIVDAVLGYTKTERKHLPYYT